VERVTTGAGAVVGAGAGAVVGAASGVEETSITLDTLMAGPPGTMEVSGVTEVVGAGGATVTLTEGATTRGVVAGTGATEGVGATEVAVARGAVGAWI